MTRRYATSIDKMPVYPDGQCNIYSIDDDGVNTPILTGLCFQERMMGYNRYYAAAAVQVKVDRVIRVPDIQGVSAHNYVDILNEGRYEIEFIQKIFDSTPPNYDITLRQLEIFT